MASAGVPSYNNGYPNVDQETATVNEKLRCCACKEYFDLKERLPRLLRCKDAICQLCCNRGLQDSGDLKCSCGVLTRTNGTNVDQLEVDKWAVCIMRFLTPASVDGDLSTVDVPRLLSSVRAHVNAATMDVIRGGVAAMSVSSPTAGSFPQAPSQLYPALTSGLAGSSRADSQRIRDLMSRPVHLPASVQNQPSRSADSHPSWATRVNTAVVPVQPTSRGLPPTGFPATGASGSNQHEESKRRTENWARGLSGFSPYSPMPSTFPGSGDSAAYFTPAVVKQQEDQGNHRRNTDPHQGLNSPMETSDADEEDRYRQADRSGVDMVSSSKPPSQKIKREDPQGSDGAEYGREDRSLKATNGRPSGVDDYDQRETHYRRREVAGDSGTSSRQPSKKRRSSSRDSRPGKDARHATAHRQKMLKGESESDDEDDRKSAKSRPPRRRHARTDGPPKRLQSLPRRRQDKEVVGGKKQDQSGRPNAPDDGDSSSSSSSGAHNGSTAKVGAKQKPARRRDPSPAMSVRSRRGAGSSLPLVMNPSLDPFFKPVPKLTKEERDESCNVCLEKLKDESNYDDAYLDARAVVRLSCGHIFHHHCAVQVVANQAEKSFVKCSSCNQTHGTRVGDQPDGGLMTVELLENKLNMVSASKKKDKTSYSWGISNPFSGKNSKPAAVDYDAFSLSGFPGTDTIRITYDFPGSGLQGPNHPNPGKYYYATAFPRIAYLPCNQQGYEVLCMLKIAFERRLIFTIGTSSTTGATDTVVWAGIHHKTSNHRGEHGYPDPGYLDRVTEELKEVGITPEDIPHNPAVSLGIGF